MTVHQVVIDDKLREIHRASGGAWGGTEVDKEYEKFLVAITGTISEQKKLKLLHSKIKVEIFYSELFNYKKTITMVTHYFDIVFSIIKIIMFRFYLLFSLYKSFGN